MKRKLLGIAIILCGAVFIAGSLHPAFADVESRFLLHELAIASGCVVVAAGALILFTGFGSSVQTQALLRVDHFLPFLRKKKKNEQLRPPSLPSRVTAVLLPKSWLADRATGKLGTARKILKWLGPTVLSAPLRRLVQSASFLAFLWLFFVTCWPYSAQPWPESSSTSGWQLKEIEAETGFLRLAAASKEEMNCSPGDTVFMVDATALDAIRGDFGGFEVISVKDKEIVLSPSASFTDRQIERLLMSAGTWDLHDRSPWPHHYAENLANKQFVSADLFLAIDPLVSLSTAIASRSWVWSLTCAAAILIVCMIFPRGFCGYLCPLGTLIDMFDWTVSKRIARFRVSDDGWWVHLKYYLLLGTLICAVCGVLVSGAVAAIPIITRAMLFIGEPLQSGLSRGWNHVPPINAGHLVSIFLFAVVLGLGLFQPRFWCKYVCPSGAVFSLGNIFRATERKVENTCIHCNKCVEICPFDAIKPDFTTRVTDCTLCQTCAGVCPTQAIKFVERSNVVELKVVNDPPTNETVLGRRGFVALAAGTGAALLGGVGAAAVTKAFGADVDAPNSLPLVRPPGSVPEREFLQMCIRCGECFKACPYNVLQPTAFEQGWEGIWTPKVVADHAGCAPSCNACGQVCPTGAIRELALEEKKVARMGLAIVNQTTCLPLAGNEACQLCVDECAAAGYYAIEFTRVHTETDAQGDPIDDSGFLAPVVLADKCVGCGLCQMSCHRVNVQQEEKLESSAIIIEAGEGKEDRLMAGSYRELREQEYRDRHQSPSDIPTADYLTPTGPSAQTDTSPFGPDVRETDAADDDPFGISP